MQQGTYGDPKNQPQVPCRALRLSIKLIACDHLAQAKPSGLAPRTSLNKQQRATTCERKQVGSRP